MKNKRFTAEESFELINSMIKQANGNVKGNSFYFLLWGWTVAFVNLAIYLLLNFTDISIAQANFAWLIVIPVVVIYFIRGYRDTEEAQIVTPLDTIVTWSWITYSITIIIIIGFGQFINFQINPLILLLSALPTIITGKALKFKPFIIGGFFFWCFGIITFLVMAKTQYLVSSIAFIVGYLIPGYLLKMAKED